MIETGQIKELRDRTGVSVMQCKKALEEAEGDTEKALVILRRKGSEMAAKKADRALGAGSVAAYVHNTQAVGAMILLASETDFVSQNAEFTALARDIAMHIAATNPEFLSRREVKDEALNAAREVFAKEVADKPAQLQEKILSGKIDAYLKDKILLEQEFIKEPGTTIQDLLDRATQKFGERIEIEKFVRFSVS